MVVEITITRLVDSVDGRTLPNPGSMGARPLPCQQKTAMKIYNLDSLLGPVASTNLIEGAIWRTVILQAASLNCHVNLEECRS